MTATARLSEWAHAIAAASPELDAEGQRIAVQTYRLLAHGEPVSVSAIADAVSIADDKVEQSLRSWPLVFWDDTNHVIGFWGLAIDRLQPTHAIEVRGRTVFGWCAWDTLFITEILGTGTRVSSTDPNNGKPVELVAAPHGVTHLDPPEAVVSLLLPDGDFGAETIQRFCHRIHFFSSSESAREWIGERDGMFTVTVEEAFDLGRAANRLRLGVRHLTEHFTEGGDR